MTDTVLDLVAEENIMTASANLNSKNNLNEYKKIMMQIENKKTRTAVESMFNFLNSDIELLQDENSSLKEFVQNIRKEIHQQRNDFDEINMNLSD